MKGDRQKTEGEAAARPTLYLWPVARAPESTHGNRAQLWIGLLVVLLLAGCARGSQDVLDVRVDATVDPMPPQLGPATVNVELRDSQDQPITGAAVELEGNMNHAGMVPVLANASEVAPGQYQASLNLGMAGDWFILVRVDLPDGRSMEHRVDLPGVADVGGDLIP